MVGRTIRRGVAAVRDSRRAARMALALWLVWAVIAWNVVLDHVIVMAGRAYVLAAALADLGRGPAVRMDDYMRPAISRGLSEASLVAGVIALVGILGVTAARAASRARIES